jgi:phosphoribosylanthranilate isomerase
MKIKASHITSLTDARYFAAKEVEWLSFNFVAHTEGYVDPGVAKAIIEWVEGCTIVAEVDFMSAEEVVAVVDALGISAVQVGMMTPVEVVAGIGLDIFVIKEVVVYEETTNAELVGILSEFAPHVGCFQLKLGEHHGLDRYLPDLCARFPIVLDFPFQLKDLADILGFISPFGLCLKGGAEERVGLKSFDELDDVFDVLWEGKEGINF